ncbi:hypothetical protein CK203_076004 [Vitis vinifera]|uniref:Reverse transcriptase domain-containing protein n=1 Tax=Vitis vinifera TaxID=29760 RepID=A0A438C1H0_VITVI|nr:hypothetical protein CK203_076004 [Vitis vinifera]
MLGFGGEGLEKDIMEFLVKIRKRRERVHSKNILGENQIERELKRLECSINYEGGKKQNVGGQVSGGDGDGGGKFSVSCRIRNVENGMTWIFTGVYGPFPKKTGIRERSRQGRLSGAMRNFAQTVDDLELIDLPMQGGIATWSGGRNNQSWARLDRGPTPFRFENMWLKVDDFKGLLRGWWQGIEARGRANFRLAYKMKVVKQNIKVWNKEVFGRVEVNKNSALQQLEYWDGVENADRGSRDEGGIVNAFQKLLSEEPKWRADIEGLQLKHLNSREAENLEVPFSEEEIHFALMEMRGDKAPGPDGFTVAFLQDCWDLVKEEAMDLFKEFFEYGSFAKVVSVDQNAFVRGRQILDASLVANEVIDYWCFGRWVWVSVDGLDEVVYFYRQILYINQWGSSWLLLEFKGAVGCGGERGRLTVSHLLFADDTLIFCKARREQLSNLSWILAWFEAASGLRINLAKSVLIPVGEVDEMEELAAELGCKWGLYPLFIWGCPLEPIIKPLLLGMGWKRE